MWRLNTSFVACLATRSLICRYHMQQVVGIVLLRETRTVIPMTSMVHRAHAEKKKNLISKISTGGRRKGPIPITAVESVFIARQALRQMFDGELLLYFDRSLGS
jgi:hypothetical protein